MVGAGHQAGFQLRAAARARAFERVVAWNLHPEMLPKLGEPSPPNSACRSRRSSLERLGAEADVIITITSSLRASLLAEHVSPGTHLACMGTDTKGKQEVEPALLAPATVFTDEVAQSVTIGEAQHAVAAGLIAEAAITPLGDVLIGTHPGRTVAPTRSRCSTAPASGLQDLAVAARIVETARARGVAIEVEV